MAAGPPGYISKPLISSQACRIFLSSGSDVREQRDTFEKIAEIASEQFRTWTTNRFHLEIDRWEQDAPRRTDGTPNAEFVRRAAEAHVTVVLVAAELRAGTREELEGVLNNPDTQLAVIHMRDPKVRDRGVKKFERENRDEFLYSLTDKPDSVAAALCMMRVVMRTIAEISRPDNGEGPIHDHLD